MQYSKKDASSAWAVVDEVTGNPLEYDAVLTKVEEKTSKAGRPMELWTFTVYNSEGQEKTIEDYVVNPSGVWKIKMLAEALGKSDEFNAETFQAADHINARMTVRLNIEQSAGFPDKNKIGTIKPARVGALPDRGADDPPF